MKAAPRSRNRTFIEPQKPASASPQSLPSSHWLGVTSILTIVIIISLLSQEALMTSSFFIIFGDLSMLLHVADAHLFYFLYSIPWYEYTTINHSTAGGQWVFSVCIIVDILTHAPWCMCTWVSLTYIARSRKIGS